MRKKLITIWILLLFVLSIYGQSTAGDNLFDDSFLHEIRFENADTNTFITTKDYQQLKMIIDETVVDSIGFKRKGNVSFYHNPNKLGIKVKTNKYVNGRKYDGIKEFMLNINFQDPSMLREKLTYDICTGMGLYSLRTAFAKVYINDEYWGLYTLVEGKDEMFKQVFDNRDMDAIESLDFGDMCYISNNSNDYDINNNGGMPTYQFENGDELTAWPKFALMIDKANNTPDDQYLDTVQKYLNLEHFFLYQAINVYLMNMDSYIGFKGNQIYFYDDIEDRWQIMPWDFNASFGLWNTNNYSPATYDMIPEAISDGCIADKINNINQLKYYYLDAMCRINQTCGDTNSYFSKIDTWKELIRQAVYDDTRKHITNAEFDMATEYGYYLLFNENLPALKTFIKERLAIVQQELIDLNYSCQTDNINEIYKTSSFKVFPNPAKSSIIIEFDGNINKEIEFKILNITGQVVFHISEFRKEINIEDLKAGVYILLLQSDSINYTRKLIKQ